MKPRVVLLSVGLIGLVVVLIIMMSVGQGGPIAGGGISSDPPEFRTPDSGAPSERFFVEAKVRVEQVVSQVSRMTLRVRDETGAAVSGVILSLLQTGSEIATRLGATDEYGCLEFACGGLSGEISVLVRAPQMLKSVGPFVVEPGVVHDLVVWTIRSFVRGRVVAANGKPLVAIVHGPGLGVWSSADGRFSLPIHAKHKADRLDLKVNAKGFVPKLILGHGVFADPVVITLEPSSMTLKVVRRDGDLVGPFTVSMVPSTFSLAVDYGVGGVAKLEGVTAPSSLHVNPLGIEKPWIQTEDVSVQASSLTGGLVVARVQPTRRIRVRVKWSDGMPIKEALVGFFELGKEDTLIADPRRLVALARASRLRYWSKTTLEDGSADLDVPISDCGVWASMGREYVGAISREFELSTILEFTRRSRRELSVPQNVLAGLSESGWEDLRAELTAGSRHFASSALDSQGLGTVDCPPGRFKIWLAGRYRLRNQAFSIHDRLPLGAIDVRFDSKELELPPIRDYLFSHCDLQFASTLGLCSECDIVIRRVASEVSIASKFRVDSQGRCRLSLEQGDYQAEAQTPLGLIAGRFSVAGGGGDRSLVVNLSAGK